MSDQITGVGYTTFQGNLRASKLTESGTRQLLDALRAPGGIAGQLQSIELVGCWHIFEWPGDVEFPALRTLTIVGSRLQAAPNLWGCPALEAVDLHDNQIGPGLPVYRPWLPPGVATVDLSYNKLHAIDDWVVAFPEQALSVDVSFNFLKKGPVGTEARATRFVTHHNEIDVRAGVLYSIDPATGVWTSPRTGETMQGHPAQRLVDRLVAEQRLPWWNPPWLRGDGDGGGGGGAGAGAGAGAAGAGAPAVAALTPPTASVYTQRQSVHDTTVQKGAREALSRVIELLAWAIATLFRGTSCGASGRGSTRGAPGGVRRSLRWLRCSASAAPAQQAHGCVCSTAGARMASRGTWAGARTRSCSSAFGR